MFHSLEIECIRLLHQFRTPFFDHFFRVLDLFDRQEFFFILIPIVWLGFGWKSGLKLFYILFLSSLTNYALKELFLSPRPFHIDSTLRVIHVSGSGFPSGAAQSVILLSGLLWKSWQSAWKSLLIACYIVLVSFSRIYLGLHFPSDILGGWLVGFSLLMIYNHVFSRVETLLTGIKPFFLLLLSQIIPLLLLFLLNATSVVRICSIAMGIGLGLYLSHIYQLFPKFPKGSTNFLLRGTIGVLGTFICYGFTLSLSLSTSRVHLISQFFLLGLWLGLGTHIISRFLPQQKESSNA